MNFKERMNQQYNKTKPKSFKKPEPPKPSNLTFEEKKKKLKHIREKSGYMDLGRRYTNE